MNRRFTARAFPLLAGAFLVAALLLSFLLRTPPPPVPQPVDMAQLEPQLREYLQQQIRWVRQKPRQAARHAALGIIYAVNGLWNEARLAFRNAVQLDHDEPLAHMYLGVAAQELDEMDEALRRFRDVTTRFPNFAPGFYRLGDALLRAGAVSEAEPAFTRLCELAPSEWRGPAGLGEIRWRQGRHAEAAALLEKAVQLDPTAKNARSLLGQAYRTLGRAEEAEIELNLGRNAVHFPMPDEWSKNASQHMKLLEDQIQKAIDYSAEGRPRQAVEVLAKALVHHPNNLSLMNQLAIALNRSEQPNKARTILQGVLAKDDRYVPALITLALVQQQLGEHAQALATAERAIALAPKLAQPYVANANVLLALERDVDAVAALEAAWRADPQNAEIPLEIGDVLWRNLNRPKDAQRHYEAARKLDPVSVPAHMRLAELHARSGETAEAHATLQRLKRIAPNLPGLAEFEKQLQKADRP